MHNWFGWCLGLGIYLSLIPAVGLSYTYNPLTWVWPRIANEYEAKAASKIGAFAALFVAVVTGGFAIFSMATGHPQEGIDGWGLVDAAAFVLIAWRLFRYSFPWSVFGIAMFLAELCWKLYYNPRGVTVATAIIMLALVAGLRGTYFLRTAKKHQQAVIRSENLPIEPS